MTQSIHSKIASIKSKAMYSLAILFTILILTLLGLVVGFLVVIGASSLHWNFLTTLPIPPGMPGSPGGMMNGVLGTLILVGLASLVGIPVGMFTGIYLAEYEDQSWIAAPVRFVSDVLAGVPSIVVGILGYQLLVVPLGGFNGWAGALALAFIMIPIVSRTTEEMLRLVPNSYREASVALGSGKAKTILAVVIPAATGSIVTGIMLAIARVAGETAPLLFTALGSRLLTTNPSQPFPSLTVQIFTYATGPYPGQKKLAWAGILVLIMIIFVLNLAVRYATGGRRTAVT
jgi:phosphate transport system permease protein